MTAEEVDRQPTGQLVVAGVEYDPAAVDGVHQLGDVVGGERVLSAGRVMWRPVANAISRSCRWKRARGSGAMPPAWS